MKKFLIFILISINLFVGSSPAQEPILNMCQVARENLQNAENEIEYWNNELNRLSQLLNNAFAILNESENEKEYYSNLFVVKFRISQIEFANKMLKKALKDKKEAEQTIQEACSNDAEEAQDPKKSENRLPVE